jgi:A/G-specific adenine glycosylase
VTARPIEEERNAALVSWYRSEGRALPWRTRPDAYRTLLAEVMCQQTQVERVVPFFERFLEQFPTIEHLAAAPRREVIAAWNGLGYNARATRLHEAAQRIVDHGWPQEVAALEELPGVGPYTARAVAAIAFGGHVAAVDTNLRRVLSRWHGEALDERAATRVATEALGTADAATWNQAVMDLGAVLCRPRRPRCGVCPVRGWCAGPDVYTPPRPQPRFEGSLRQLRGAIVRRLVQAPATFSELIESTGFSAAEVEEAIDGLVVAGLAELHGTAFRLPD